MHVEISFISEQDFGVKVGVLLKLCNIPLTGGECCVSVISQTSPALLHWWLHLFQLQVVQTGAYPQLTQFP